MVLDALAIGVLLLNGGTGGVIRPPDLLAAGRPERDRERPAGRGSLLRGPDGHDPARVRARAGLAPMGVAFEHPESPRLGTRFVAFGVIAALLFTVIAGRLFQLQVVEGAVRAEEAAAAHSVAVAIPSQRGLIFDREGRPLVVNVPTWTVAVRPADLPDHQRDAVLGRVSEVTTIPSLRPGGAARCIPRIAIRPGAGGGGRWTRSGTRPLGAVGGPARRGAAGRAAPAVPQRAWRGRRRPARPRGRVHRPDQRRGAGGDGRRWLPPRRRHRPHRDRGHLRAGAARGVRHRPLGAGSHRPAGEGAGRDAGAGRRPEPGPDHRRSPATDGDRRAAVGHERGPREPGRDDRDEPADRRDPGHGLAAVI